MLLHSKNASKTGEFDNLLVESHHDIIISTIELPVKTVLEKDDLKVAPKVDNVRLKIYWKEEKFQDYQRVLNKKLPSLRKMWSSPSSMSSLSLLLELTSKVMTEAAVSCNSHIKLGITAPSKKTSLPTSIRQAQSAVHAALKQLK